MTYEYIDHEADVGILSSGDTVEKAFCEGAKAMFNVMVDIDEVKDDKKVTIECQAESIPILFIEWLNELISQGDIHDMFFSEFSIVSLTKLNDHLVLKGIAKGEIINLEKHKVKTEVKAATYSGLKYEQKENKHYLQCVLDL